MTNLTAKETDLLTPIRTGMDVPEDLQDELERIIRAATVTIDRRGADAVVDLDDCMAKLHDLQLHANEVIDAVQQVIDQAEARRVEIAKVRSEIRRERLAQRRRERLTKAWSEIEGLTPNDISELHDLLDLPAD